MQLMKSVYPTPERELSGQNGTVIRPSKAVAFSNPRSNPDPEKSNV